LIVAFQDLDFIISMGFLIFSSCIAVIIITSRIPFTHGRIHYISALTFLLFVFIINFIGNLYGHCQHKSEYDLLDSNPMTIYANLDGPATALATWDAERGVP